MQNRIEMRGATSPPAAAPLSPSSTHWLGVALVVAAGVVASLQVGKVAIAVPQLRTDFGLDLTMVGWLMATFSLLGVVGAVPVGAWVARAGDRRLLVAGLLAIAIGSMVGAWAQGIAMLLIGRVVEGLGFVLITIAGPSVLQRMVAPGGKDLAFAIWSCFMPAGIAIALFSGSLPGSWRGLWLGNAALAGLIAVLVLAGVSRGASANTREAPVSWRSMARDAAATAKAGAPALIAASFVIYSLQFFALFSFLPVLLIERMGVGTATAGQLSAAACCVNVAGNLAAGMLLQRGIARWLLAALASAAMGIASIGIFLPVLGAVPAFVLCLVFSGAGGLLPATLIGTSPIVAPSTRLVPMSMGLLMLGSNLGQMIGPVIVGGAVDSLGWPAAAAIVALAGAMGVLLALGLRRSMARGGHRL
ncbi:putative MFS family arabinose efflux permease [Variovorax paradoxus]|uniref:MFS family arabinose efflux permease n=1 Tax=Variovorax paradoxus TaxID=34073 RepID=A0AAW8EET9_VARPD|nr:MFS transporter [Variovorax paradoxus]MDP9971508.1 putative MFS family arabinose efflux permease [Variovorax paradoxus]